MQISVNSSWYFSCMSFFSSQISPLAKHVARQGKTWIVPWWSKAYTLAGTLDLSPPLFGCLGFDVSAGWVSLISRQLAMRCSVLPHLKHLRAFHQQLSSVWLDFPQYLQDTWGVGIWPPCEAPLTCPLSPETPLEVIPLGVPEISSPPSSRPILEGGIPRSPWSCPCRHQIFGVISFTVYF